MGWLRVLLIVDVLASGPVGHHGIIVGKLLRGWCFTCPGGHITQHSQIEGAITIAEVHAGQVEIEEGRKVRVENSTIPIGRHAGSRVGLKVWNIQSLNRLLLSGHTERRGDGILGWEVLSIDGVAVAVVLHHRAAASIWEVERC